MNEPGPATPSDVIVGSWQLPTPIRRSPRPVWAFVAAAFADLVIRVVVFGGFRVLDRPGDAVVVLLSALPSAAFVLLPAAVLLGTWPRRMASRMLVGAGLLALSELVWLAVSVVTFGPTWFGDATDVLALMEHSRAVDSGRVVAEALALAGVSILAWGVALVKSRPYARSWRAYAAVVVAIAVAGALAGVTAEANLLSIYVRVGADPSAARVFITLPALIANGVEILTGLAWGALAVLSVVRAAGATTARRGWKLLAIAATLLVVSYAMSQLVSLLLTTPTQSLLVLAIHPLQSIAFAIGVACLVVALALGLGAEPDDPPGTPKPGTIQG
jgi:hypothetical protein